MFCQRIKTLWILFFIIFGVVNVNLSMEAFGEIRATKENIDKFRKLWFEEVRDRPIPSEVSIIPRLVTPDIVERSDKFYFLSLDYNFLALRTLRFAEYFLNTGANQLSSEYIERAWRYQKLSYEFWKASNEQIQYSIDISQRLIAIRAAETILGVAAGGLGLPGLLASDLFSTYIDFSIDTGVRDVPVDKAKIRALTGLIIREMFRVPKISNVIGEPITKYIGRQSGLYQKLEQVIDSSEVRGVIMQTVGNLSKDVILESVKIDSQWLANRIIDCLRLATAGKEEIINKILTISPACTASVPSDRWKGEYFNNKNLNGTPSMVRDDGTGDLNFSWPGSPSPTCGIGADNFSVRWTRYFYLDGGTWRFSVTADDGVRLYVDNTLKLDKWFDQPATTYSVDVLLSSGNHTLRMEYYESGGQAVAKLSWQKVLPPPKWEEIPSSSFLLPNFRKVNDKIFAGGQPKSEEAVKWLANRGIKAIVNLESVIEEELKKEKEWAKKYNINYIWYPTPPTALPPVRCPTKNEIETAIIIINNPNNQPVYVHCLRGIDRTGIVIAAYRVKMESWSVEAAINEWKKSGILYLPSWEKCFRDYYIVTQPIEKTTITPLKEPIISKSIPLGPYPSGQKYYLRVFNVDDVSKVKINGREILSVGYYTERELDITGYLVEGKNSIELTLENISAGWTYGYTLRQLNNVIWNESCGRVGIEGCRNNDQTKGIVARHLINLSITSQAISTPTVLPTEGTSSIPILRWPLSGKPTDRRVLLGFGKDWTWGYCSGLPKRHTGVDLSASVGEDVFASESGTVKTIFLASSTYNWGQGITIQHSGFTTLYLHVSPIVSIGQSVTRGQKIATIANIPDYHLHYGVRRSTYSSTANRGALPQKSSSENTFCQNDPLFPESFIDPMSLKFDISVAPPTVAPTPVCTDGSQFVADVTIPDNSRMQPGQSFTKTWRLKNTGNCSWGSGYSLVFMSGSKMGAPGSVSVLNTPVNATADISVPMIAPSSLGTYQGYWQMKNAKGQAFGPQIWVKINVASGTSANLAPNLPTNLFQFKADGVTGMAAGATTNQNTVVLKGGVSDPNNDTVKLQIELRRLDEYGGQFTGTSTQESAFVSSGSTAAITAYGLINGNYHWRARGVDSKGAISNWLSAGGNPDSAADFIVSVGPAQPSTPVITSPGSSSEPGQMISILTPTLQWNAVSGADYYALAISKYPYGSGNIIYNPQQIYGTSLAVPSGILQSGQKYRWNIQAHTPGGWSAVSNTLYFYISTTVSPTVINPQIASVSPTQVQAGQFTLTINGSNFDSGAIDQFYTPSGQLMGSGAQSGGLVSRNSNQIVVRENLTGAPGGTYSVKVKNSDGKMSNAVNISVTATVQPTPPTSGPSISAISPSQIQAGQFTLTINGSGFDSGAVDQFYTPSGQYMGSGALSGGLVSRYSNQIVVRENLTGAQAGIYSVRVKNSDGKISPPVSIQVMGATPPPPAQPQPTKTVANTGGYGLNLRSAPGVSSSVISKLPEGMRVTVIGGPRSADGYTWWNISTANGTGWSAVGDWLTPSPTVGSTVAVGNTGGYGLKLRKNPCINDTQCPKITTLSDGTQVKVSGGPVQADGYTWWNVTTQSGTGWIAVGNWLIP